MIKLSKIEEAVTITKLQLGFPSDFKTAGWTDSHEPKAPFGVLWGRGVVGDQRLKDGTLATVVGGYSTSHANLKTKVLGGVKKTFYFGFKDGTLYLENGSVGSEHVWSNDLLISIATALAERGPLRGATFKIKGG